MSFPPNTSGDEARAKVATWERHGQTIMLAVVTATLMFSGKFMWEVNRQMAEIVSENKNLTLQVAKLEGTVVAFQSAYISRNEFTAYIERLRALESSRR